MLFDTVVMATDWLSWDRTSVKARWVWPDVSPLTVTVTD